MAEEEYDPLFETTRRGKGRIVYIIFSLSLLVGICFIWFYRVNYILKGGEDIGIRWVCRVGLFCAELWFGLYWVLRQALRWNPVFRRPFPHTLSQRYHTFLIYFIYILKGIYMYVK